MTSAERGAAPIGAAARARPRPDDRGGPESRPGNLSEPQRRNRAPRFSLFFFASAHERSTRQQYQLMLESARLADELGFEAIWIPERHFDPFGAPYPSPAVLAAALAASTRRLEIRAGSVVLPLQDPVRVAEDWAVVDNLSGGRAGMAFASGWHPNDFVFAPHNYEMRKQVTLDHVSTVRRLLAGDAIERRDGHGTEVTVRTYPQPVRLPMPMWLTSVSSADTWRMAAAHGLNVLTGLLDQSLAQLTQNAAIYQECLRQAGDDRNEFTVTAMVHTFIGKPGEDVRSIVREPLTGYLRAHLDLYAKSVASKAHSADAAPVSEADRDALAAFGFERYFRSGGLFGTVERALPQVRRMVDAGIDEVACLVDFGLPAEIVLSHLDDLARLQDLAKTEALAGSRS